MASFLFIFGNHLTKRLLNRYISEKQGAVQKTQTHGGNANMRINMNGTTITGSVSEVLATLTHLGIKASDTKPVTLPLVTEIAVTTPFEVVEAELAKLHAGETVTPEATPKLTRDGVIQQAIDDVEALLSRNHTDSTRRGKESNRIATHIGHNLWFSSENGLFSVNHAVDFVVNADKRTVVAIINWMRRNEEISKGRAKCAPGDVFNEHIGKAIALRRALGLEVPVEYFEAGTRDRDDLEVGDVVRGDYSGSYYEITKFSANPHLKTFTGKFVNGGYPSKIGYLSEDLVTLINDSARHTAPDLEVSRIIRH